MKTLFQKPKHNKKLKRKKKILNAKVLYRNQNEMLKNKTQ